MKTFRMIGTALMAVTLGFAMSACSDDDDYLKELEKEYSRLIVGKWFNFTPEASMFWVYQPDGKMGIVGWDKEFGWFDTQRTYRLEGNKLIETDAVVGETKAEIEIINGKMIVKPIYPVSGEKIHYKVNEQFDITGKYSYLNSAVRVVAATGKTEIKLPEGITFGGKNTISVEALHGDRIVEQMKSFFADAMFTPNAKLRHTVDGTVMYKDYALDGNNLSFELNKGHQLNATSFPDEDGDRLFIIIPKQEAWVGGLADVIRKENPANVITDEVVAALEKEFMDTFETFTVVLSLSKTGEYNAAEDVDPYKDYAELIVGKWFNFTPEASMFLNYQADNTYNMVGWDKEFGWLEMSGTYRLEGNKLTESYTWTDGSQLQTPQLIEIKDGKLVFLSNLDMPEVGEKINYRVQESFDITGKYTYLNSAVRVVAAAGKTEIKLPEGITFGGKNTISVEALNGDRIVEQMKSFFADAMFTPNAQLRHTVDGTVMYKDYALDGNNLSFELNKGHQLNATSFPDEDGDRLFIIIPKQEAWVGGLADVIRKENPANVITDEVVAALEKEFMDTFETFTVVLSLSKTGEYNAAEDVDPYKDYPQLIVGQWFDFTPQSSMYLVFESDNSYSQVGYGVSNGWRERRGTYRMEGNKLTREYVEDGESVTKTEVIEVTADKFIQMRNDATGDRVNYRVKESFDIAGKYTYLNSAVRVDAEAGKTALQLPEGITFQGKNSIPVEMLHGERIIEASKAFFADATFAADGKLEHQMGGETKHKNYTLDGNSLVFNLYEGSEVYKVNATTFPDEDGDRLFIIIPKQAAWMGGFVELIEKENTGLKMTEAQIKELETEFLTTFDTFTVILSLSKK